MSPTLDLSPPYRLGETARITGISIRGTKYRFPFVDGKLSAEINYAGQQWGPMPWTHEKCVQFIEERKFRKDGFPNFKWSFLVQLGDEVFEINKPLEEINLVERTGE